jgi:hypothetical protein
VKWGRKKKAILVLEDGSGLIIIGQAVVVDG